MILPIGRTFFFALLMALPVSSATVVHAQQSRLDLAVTYVAERSAKANANQNFWEQGGSIELGGNISHGFGFAADVTGTHTASIGSSGIPFSMVTVTLGPRYRWQMSHQLSMYGQGLIGGAAAFKSLFPSTRGAALESANSFAAQVGGGIDCRVSTHFVVRMIDADWVRTQLPNSTDNVQNSLRLASGIAFHFGI